MISKPMEVFESTRLRAGPWLLVSGFGQKGTQGLSEPANSRAGLYSCLLVLWQNSQKCHEVMSVNMDGLHSKE